MCRLAYVIKAGLLASILLSVACTEPVETEVAAPPPEVVIYKVQSEDTPVASEFVAKTASSRKVEIRSRVEGFLEKRLYTEGTMVEEGQPLFQMDSKPFESKLNAAKAELAQQMARLDTAEANLKRVRPLAKKNAVAQKELDDATGNYRTAAAAVEVAKSNVVQAELDLGYTHIKSPVAGISSFAVQQEGAYVGFGSGSLLTYVAQIEPMWVEFSISENQLLRKRKAEKEGLIRFPGGSDIEEGMAGRSGAPDFTVDLVLADGSAYPHTGSITFADASISEETGTFLIRAEIANTEGLLRPGQFVRAYIRGGVRPNAIRVPKKAVQQGAKGSFVWVINTESKAEFRPVVPGPWQDDLWFINSGLHDGDQVVVEGASKLRAGVPVKLVAAKQTDTETKKN
jgi:membrane fusion protein (multidrug efflux system)